MTVMNQHPGKKSWSFFFFLRFLSGLGYIPVEKDGRACGRKDWFGHTDGYHLCTQNAWIREEILLGTSVTSRSNRCRGGTSISLSVRLHLSLARLGLALYPTVRVLCLDTTDWGFKEDLSIFYDIKLLQKKGFREILLSVYVTTSDLGVLLRGDLGWHPYLNSQAFRTWGSCALTTGFN